jgi:hypothetical protein
VRTGSENSGDTCICVHYGTQERLLSMSTLQYISWNVPTVELDSITVQLLPNNFH